MTTEATTGDDVTGDTTGDTTGTGDMATESFADSATTAAAP